MLFRSSVLRSVVFGICIAGCLTDNREQRAFLRQLMETQTQQAEKVGNVAEVMEVMKEVWALRDRGAGSGETVSWRDVMARGAGLLLLV